MKNGRPGQTLNAHLAGLRCYKLKRPAGTSTSMRSRSSSIPTKNSSTSGMSRGDCPSAPIHDEEALPRIVLHTQKRPQKTRLRIMDFPP